MSVFATVDVFAGVCNHAASAGQDVDSDDGLHDMKKPKKKKAKKEKAANYQHGTMAALGALVRHAGHAGRHHRKGAGDNT